MKIKRKLFYTLLLASFSAPAVSNSWPVSAADFAETSNNSSVTIPVLDNDTGDNLTVIESNDWTQNGGRTSIIGNAVKYSAPKDFTGTDAFWYVMKDSEGRTNSAKVSIEVTESTVSAWPVGTTDTRKITTDRKAIRIAVLANDTGDNLTIAETNKWTKEGGRTRIIGNKIKYWPPVDFVGLDTFWYVLTDSQGRTNSAKVRVRISEAAKVEKSVVAFCGATYETDGTAAGTSLSLLSPETPTTVPEQPEAVDGVITVDGRTYTIDESVSPAVLTMTNEAGSTSTIVTASSDTSIEIIGGHNSTSKAFFAVGKRFYSHDGSNLTTIAEDYTELLPSALPVTGYVRNENYALFVTTGIAKSDESSTDDFYFKVSASLNSGPSGSITLRMDSTTSKAVEAGISFGEPNGRVFSATTEDKFYYFNGLDYSQNRDFSTLGTYSRSIIQRNNGEVSNTFADVNVESYIEDRDRLFIITEEVDVDFDNQGEIASPRIPSKLLVIDDNNEFVELSSCDNIATPSPQPVADAANAITSEFASINVLANDAGDELTIKEANYWTANGGNTWVADNVIKYRSAAGFTGTDTFWYVMQDKYGRTNSAEVTVTVTEAN